MSSILDDIAGLAQNMGKGLIPTAAYDVVGIFDQNYNQVFRTARPIKATVKEPSKAMKHPIESGGTVADHIVFLPVQIELSLVLAPDEYRNTYEQIRQTYKSATLLTVQTNVGAYENMWIVDLPHDETPEMFGTISIGLRLEEVKFVEAQFQKMPTSTVKSAANSSTQNNGAKQTGEATAAQTNSAKSSFAYDLLH